VLLRPGVDLAQQGWLVLTQGPATLTNTVDEVSIVSTTTEGASTGGQLLIYLPDAVPTDAAFSLQVVVAVDRATHDALDAGAAILGGYLPPFGTSSERAQMVYLATNALGWGDDTGSFAGAAGNGLFHTYVLAVDADGAATLTFDGQLALTRAGFVTNGTIALGDQSNDAGIDGQMRVKSVTLLCL